MGAYDNRRVTLDSGLTALALRGLHERNGHYPFLDRFRARRRAPRRAMLHDSARRFGALLWLLPLRWRPTGRPATAA